MRKVENQRKQHISYHHIQLLLIVVLVVQSFLGNIEADSYYELVGNMVPSFCKLGCIMSIKLRYTSITI